MKSAILKWNHCKYIKKGSTDMAEPINDNYIGIEEAADYLGVKVPTIRTWIKSKGMPFHRIGGKLLKFKRSEIDAWVCNNQAPEATQKEEV